MCFKKLQPFVYFLNKRATILTNKTEAKNEFYKTNKQIFKIFEK